MLGERRRVSTRQIRFLTVVGVCALLMIEWLTTVRAVTRYTRDLDVIYGNAIPSIEELAEALDGLNDLRRDMRRLVFEPASPARRGDVASHAESASSAIRLHAAAYEKFPAFEDEPPLQRRMDRALETLEHAIHALLDAHGEEAVRTVAAEQFFPAIDAAYTAVNDIVRLNARESSRMARYVYTAQGSAARWTLWLLLSFVVLVAAVGSFIDRALRQVEQARSQLVSDLDAFGARVAHDLRGPLTPITLGIASLRRECAPHMTDKAETTLQRIERRCSA